MGFYVNPPIASGKEKEEWLAEFGTEVPALSEFGLRPADACGARG